MEFSNGDPPIRLLEIGEGFFAGTWAPRVAGSGTLRIDARDPVAGLRGSAEAPFSVRSTAQDLKFTIPDFPVAIPGGEPQTQTITVTSDDPGQAFSVKGSYFGGRADQFTVEPESAVTPATIQLRFAPTVDLPPNTVSYAVLEFDVSGVSFLSIPFPILVSEPLPPQLVVKNSLLVFSFKGAAGQRTREALVENASGIPLHFKASVNTPWLSVTPAEGDTTFRQPAAIAIKADPAGLKPGTYSGTVTLSAGDRPSNEIAITMTVTAGGPSIVLSQTGMSFSAAENGRTEPEQTFRILNDGQSDLNWSARLRTPASWLRIEPDTGRSPAGAPSGPEVKVIADASGLPVGQYYALVEVNGEGADNGPQFVTVTLRVLPNLRRPIIYVRPSGLVFSGASRGLAPPAQSVAVYDLSGGEAKFVSASATFDGADWLSYDPTRFGPDGSSRIDVLGDPSLLTPGTRRGAITLLFSDGSSRVINILFQVASQPALSAASRSNKRSADSDCVAKSISVEYTATSGLALVGGWPATIRVRAVDACNQPMTAGAVRAAFSTGEPVLDLNHDGDGLWSGSWTPSRGPQKSVKLSFFASDRSRGIEGKEQFPVEVPKTDLDPPVLDSVSDTISRSFTDPLAPGSLFTASGDRLATTDGTSAAAPYPVTLGDARILIAGRETPISYASRGRVSGVLPLDLPVNVTTQMILSRGATISVGAPVTIAAAQPSLFTVDGSGSGQARVYHADQPESIAGASSPARRGELLVIECAGLGATSNPVQVTMGGLDAQVVSVALKDGAVGVYQVRAVVPAGVAPSATVPLEISAAERKSAAKVFIAVQ